MVPVLCDIHPPTPFHTHHPPTQSPLCTCCLHLPITKPQLSLTLLRCGNCCSYCTFQSKPCILHIAQCTLHSLSCIMLIADKSKPQVQWLRVALYWIWPQVHSCSPQLPTVKHARYLWGAIARYLLGAINFLKSNMCVEQSEQCECKRADVSSAPNGCV